MQESIKEVDEPTFKDIGIGSSNVIPSANNTGLVKKSDKEVQPSIEVQSVKTLVNEAANAFE